MKKIRVETTTSQDPLVNKGANLVPIPGVDVWDYAYYLQNASKLIATRSSSMDGPLFLVEHLLILREQIAPFDVDFSVVHKELDFSHLLKHRLHACGPYPISMSPIKVYDPQSSISMQARRLRSSIHGAALLDRVSLRSLFTQKMKRLALAVKSKWGF